MKKALIAAGLGLTLLAGTTSVFAHDRSGDAVAATMIGAIAGAMLSQNTGYSYYQPAYGYPTYYTAPAYYQQPVYGGGYYGYYGHDWHHDRHHEEHGHHGDRR